VTAGGAVRRLQRAVRAPPSIVRDATPTNFAAAAVVNVSGFSAKGDGPVCTRPIVRAPA
jgi:hypothetical protein